MHEHRRGEARPRDDTRLLAGLNSAQRKAVTADNGAMLIAAGPGSGKTRVTCTRIAYLIRNRGVPPNRIAAITFTRRAANEMQARTAELIGAGTARSVWISTFHRLCGAILRAEGSTVGVAKDFRIVQGREQLTRMREAMFQNRVDARVHKPAAMVSTMSFVKNQMADPTDPSEYGEHLDGEMHAEVAKSYQRLLQDANELDFDDMLLHAVAALARDDTARARQEGRFAHILVDEYQDTNVPQYHLIRLLRSTNQNVFVVGDPDQAIYGWRGADISNILSFDEDFPTARRIDLELTYRCPPRILAGAAALIEHNEDRLKRRLRATRDDETPIEIRADARRDERSGRSDRTGVAGQTAGGETAAVLYRTNAQSRALERECRRRATPYRITSGESFYQRPEIRNVLACLQIAVDPYRDDEAARRFLDLPPGGRVGSRGLEMINDAGRGASLWERAENGARQHRLPRGIQYTVTRRLDMAEALTRNARQGGTDRLIDAVMQVTGYAGALTNAEGDGDEALETIEELTTDAVLHDQRQKEDPAGAEAGSERVQAFVDDCTQMAEAAAAEETAPGVVTLSTLHGAKGLEFDTVVITGFDDARLPHARSLEDAAKPREALEEERRLAYVGATRARRRLVLSVAAWTGAGARQRRRRPSPFIYELKAENVRWTGETA